MNLTRAIKINTTKALQLEIIDENDKFFFKLSQFFANPIEKIYDEEYIKKEVAVGIALVLDRSEYVELVKFLTDFINQENDIKQDKIDILKDVNDWLDNPEE